MSNLCKPKMKTIMEGIKRDMEKSRLLFLKYEFYAYMEEQGYPNFWDTCNGILYPRRDIKNRSDRSLYWFFRFKDGTETRIVLNCYNKKFQELRNVKT